METHGAVAQCFGGVDPAGSAAPPAARIVAFEAAGRAQRGREGAAMTGERGCLGEAVRTVWLLVALGFGVIFLMVVLGILLTAFGF